MIQKYVFGSPFETDAVTATIPSVSGLPSWGSIDVSEGFCFTYLMNEDDIVYGLGEANRGINKRGYVYVSNCTDDNDHDEGKTSLYGAHNFIVLSGSREASVCILTIPAGSPLISATKKAMFFLSVVTILICICM